MDTLLHAAKDGRRRENPRHGGDQFNGKRETIESPADFRNRGRIVVSECKRWSSRPGTLDKERYRIVR
jgi:hypothetical protein